MSLIPRLILIIAVASFSYSTKAEKAIFAGGCFWCMEAAFQDLAGVTDVVSGFTGGKLKNPTYKGNHNGHYEAIEVTYDASQINYQQLLAKFWVNIDPFDDQGQFCDKGFSYRSAIFVGSSVQRVFAEASHSAIVKQFPKNTVVTPILPAKQFWPVEESHQDYYQKNPLRYKYYRYGCGRDKRLEQVWGKEDNH